MEMKPGLKLWQEALKVIPGGNGLLSKRPDRYAPDIWPTYFSRAKGVKVWDLEGQSYVDMAQMGIGSAILGYCFEEVDRAVKNAIDLGINTTLNAPEEVYLAQKLIDLNPFAGGVKFARTGGEAMAMAVRIARAYSGKDKVAFSGYHGWSDWYLSANLTGEDNLKEHLLPGLDPQGVPRGLAGSALPFNYNNLDELKAIATHHDLAAIIIEGARYDFPAEEFLQGIEAIAKAKNAVIIADEITSGWRMTDGGVYKINGFKPDLVVYGKAMGNGYAISAVLGRHSIMQKAQETFISSTFWTERVGFVAALKTIEVLTREKVWGHLIATGERIGQEWLRLARKHGLKLMVTDFKPLITMKFQYEDQNPAIQTLFIQEMLKRGYLASTSIYVSYAHTSDIIDAYLKAVDEVFALLAESIENQSIHQHLSTSIRSDAFRRLN